MKTINSVVFVPQEAKRLASLIALDPMEEIKQKLRNNPVLRDEIAMESKFSKISFGPETIISEKQTGDIETIDLNDISKTEKYSGEKNIIKNLTEGMICLNFGEKDRSKKPITFEYFLNKNKLTEEQLQSKSFLAFYETDIPMIEDITEEQMIEELKEIKEKKKQEDEELQRRIANNETKAENALKEVRSSTSQTRSIPGSSGDHRIRFKDGTEAFINDGVSETIEVEGSEVAKGGLSDIFTTIEDIGENEKIQESDIR